MKMKYKEGFSSLVLVLVAIVIIGGFIWYIIARRPSRSGSSPIPAAVAEAALPPGLSLGSDASNVAGSAASGPGPAGKTWYTLKFASTNSVADNVALYGNYCATHGWNLAAPRGAAAAKPAASAVLSCVSSSGATLFVAIARQPGGSFVVMNFVQ